MRASGRTREGDAEFQWVEDLAEHLKTIRKDKMLRELLARDDEKKSDALHDLDEYELPPGATGKEHDPTLHDLLHKMNTLTQELNQLKEGSKLTHLDTTITGLSYLGDKRSPLFHDKPMVSQRLCSRSQYQSRRYTRHTYTAFEFLRAW